MLLRNTHVTLKSRVKPYGILNLNFQRDNLRETTRHTKSKRIRPWNAVSKGIFVWKKMVLYVTIIDKDKSGFMGGLSDYER